jgi:uncharacterized protein YjbI with pentapeptide repeats
LTSNPEESKIHLVSLSSELSEERSMSRSMLRAARTILSSALIFAAGWGVARAANPDHVQQLLDTRKCLACDLSGAQLSGFALTGADLGGSDLRAADLRDADLYRAQLGGADLTGADLTGTNLGGVDLRTTKGADLTGAKTNEQTYCPDGQQGPCR